MIGLAADGRRGADEVALVVGHVDDGGDAAGRGGAGGPDKILLAALAQRMDLRVDGAGEDQAGAEIVALAGGWRGAVADARDLAIAHGEVAGLDDAVGEDDGAGEDEVEIGHAWPVRWTRRRSR